MPQRIQRKRTKGWRMPQGAVYVGRGSKWGNPFVAGKTQIRTPGVDAPWEHEGRLHKVTGERNFFCTGTDDVGMPVGFWHDVKLATVDQVVELYRQRMLRTDVANVGFGEPLAVVRSELAGKDLACWCPLVDAQGNPVPCHADVLLELANAEAGE